MKKLGFIGAGPVGTTFGVRLFEKGYPVIGVADIHPGAAQRFAGPVPGCRVFGNNQELADAADMVFITTADDFIATVSAGLKWRSGQTVVHCSGASTVRSLETARQQGARVGSIHPCQTFAGVEQAIANLPGSTFAIEAEEPVKTTLTKMALALQGDIVYLTSEDKVLYHAQGHACNSQTRGVEMKKALEKLEMVVISDPYPTHMAVMSDRKDGIYLLPTATQFETVGSVSAANRSLQWREKVIDPLFESLPDHVVLYKLAKKLGFAEQLFKNIKVNQEEPLIEDVLREINRGCWTIGYTGQTRSG